VQLQEMPCFDSALPLASQMICLGENPAYYHAMLRLGIDRESFIACGVADSVSVPSC